MLIEFKFKNYRSFRDESVLSMEATGLSTFKNSLIELPNKAKMLPALAIYGKNGGGKSNVIRAFWLAVQFIKNAQRTQHESAEIPVVPFILDDDSRDLPTEFSFNYVFNDIQYIYGFSATKKTIISEYLYHTPKGQKALVFSRNNQSFKYTTEVSKRKLIEKMVAPNQLFFSIASAANDTDCINAMRWFRECVFFSRDYSDIPAQLLEFSEDKKMLESITDYAKAADLGIVDMQFKFNSEIIETGSPLPERLPEGLKEALSKYIKSLSETSNGAAVKLHLGEVSATANHQGINKKNENSLYPLDISDESDGTRKLMSLAPAVESALRTGGILLVDEIEKELHPKLVNFLISKFQSKKTNTNGAQIIFTTHSTELMNLELLRKDQICFADKRNSDGVSELYSISDFATRTTENIRKGYLVGKYGAIPDVDLEEVD